MMLTANGVHPAALEGNKQRERKGGKGEREGGRVSEREGV